MVLCVKCGNNIEHTGKRGRPKRAYTCERCKTVTAQLEPLNEVAL